MKFSKSKSDEPYDEFYASLKLTSGEEILALVMVELGETENIVVSNPVVCEEIRSSGTNIPMGYKFEPWMKLTDDDTFVISLQKTIFLPLKFFLISGIILFIFFGDAKKTKEFSALDSFLSSFAKNCFFSGKKP